MERFDHQKSEHYRAGVIVFALLAIFTAIEFTVSQMGNWASALQAAVVPALIVLALIKSFLVVRDYMHLGKVFYGEEES